MYYPDEVIEEVRSGNDIINVVQTYVPLRQRGSTYVGRCPFHNDKTPSFSVVPGDQFFHCFGCGAAGNVINFIMRIENYDFVDALKLLADRINYTLPDGGDMVEAKRKAEFKDRLFSINKTAARFFYDLLRTDEGSEASAYLDKRRISPRMRIRFGLGYSNRNRNILHTHLREQGFDDIEIQKSGLADRDGNGIFRDKFYSRLMFPIFDAAGRVVGFGGRIMGNGEPKYLNSPETPLFNKSKNLYGINHARLEKSREFILVEGYMDVISLHQAGFRNAVAALGTAFTADHAKLIRRYAERVIVLFDSDEAGMKAAERAIPILKAGGISVRALKLPGAKDPDEFLAEFGREALAEQLSQAANHIVFQVSNLKNKHNLGSTEGKIEFTKDVSKLLSNVENGIERDAFTYEVAQMTKISEQSIKAEIAKNTPAIDPSFAISDRMRVKRVENGALEAKKGIIRIIVENPYVFSAIKQHLTPDELGGGVYTKLLELVYEYRENNREIQIAELLNRFTDPDVSDAAASVFITGVYTYTGKADIEKEINDIVKAIKRHNIEQSINNEKNAHEIQKMLKLKRNLEELYITITGG